MTTATGFAYDQCAPYPLRTDLDNREPVPSTRTSQYVGPIFEADGTSSTYAPTLATSTIEETS